MERKKIGLLGGGQLGRMLAYPASLLNLDLTVLDPLPDAPAKQVLNLSSTNTMSHIEGSFTDEQTILRLASRVDLLTVEIEHVNVSALEKAKATNGVEIHPAPSTLRTIQDKLIQKQWFERHSVPVAPFVEIDSTEESVKVAGVKLGYPFMLKSRTLAYDGRGNYVIEGPNDTVKALNALGAGQDVDEVKKRKLYAEKWVKFEREVAVMVVKGKNGEIRSYPPVETIHRDSICHLVFAPLRAKDNAVPKRITEMAEKAVGSFEGAGVFGVEMFLLQDGSLLLNEIAPRPHNSGHYTIEACECSQYENHLRAILGLPLGSTKLKVGAAVMLNILGPAAKPKSSHSLGDLLSKDSPTIDGLSQKTLSIPGATIHLYGKAESRPGRKMGHITIVGSSDAEVRSRLRPLLIQLGVDSKKAIDERLAPALQHDAAGVNANGKGFSSRNPLVGIIMGSDSDLPVMLAAAKILDDLRIEYELTIVSAHRTPNRLVSYARAAVSRGLRVIIAGAGGAAHLPGMVASMMPLPVVGVPVKGSSLDGVDSLYSIVQMPRGIPVATVAINNATNAGLLAARIVGCAQPELLQKITEYSEKLEKEVLGKADKLENVGWEEYVVKK